MAVAGAYGTAMAVELEMGPIMNWTAPARGHGGSGGSGEKKSRRKRQRRNDSGRTAAAEASFCRVQTVFVSSFQRSGRDRTTRMTDRVTGTPLCRGQAYSLSNSSTTVQTDRNWCLLSQARLLGQNLKSGGRRHSTTMYSTTVYFPAVDVPVPSTSLKRGTGQCCKTVKY